MPIEWRELLAMQCGWCDRPADTRIFLRGPIPSEDDLWCCVHHRRAALELADEFQAWTQTLATTRRGLV